MKYTLIMFYYLSFSEPWPDKVIEVAEFKTELDCYSEGLYYSAKYQHSGYKTTWLCLSSEQSTR